MMSAMNVRQRRQRGFTVVELMIATAVFSVVLILITTGVIQFTRQYYKGVIATNTQNTARAIVDDITRAIQFGSGGISELRQAPGDPVTGYCIGQTERYSFALNSQITDTKPHALVADAVSGCASGSAPLDVGSLASFSSLPATSKPRELLGEHMRLAAFTINPVSSSPGLYGIDVKVVYGDTDLLCSTSIAAGQPGSCAKGSPDASSAATFAGHDDISCRSTIGSQFCAVSQLHTTVQMRLQ